MRQPGGRARTALLCCAVAVALAARGGAQSLPPCATSCDGDAQFTAAELLLVVDVGLGGAPTSRCPSADGNTDAALSIGEIVTQIVGALGTCQLVGTAVVEAAKGVEAATGEAVELALALDSVAAAATCSLDGSRQVSCSADGGTSTRHTVYTACIDRDATTSRSLTRNGTLTEAVDDANLCNTGVIPPSAHVTLTFEDFTQSDGMTTTSIATLTDTLDASGDGCAGRNGKRSLDGVLRVTGGGKDVTYTYRPVTLDVESSGTPCLLSNTAKGTLTVDDPGKGRRFNAAIEGFARMTFEPSAMARLLIESGRLTAACVGAIDLLTSEPLFFDPGAACPSGGLLQVSVASAGSTSRLRFRASGEMELDFNGDGEADKVVTSCDAASLAQCTSHD